MILTSTRFNDHRKALITAGVYITLDEMMSACKGAENKYTAEGCPGLTYIARKPEPWGIEFKSVCCGITGICLFLEIQEGKERMAKAKFRDHYPPLSHWCFAYVTNGQGPAVLSSVTRRSAPLPL